MPPSSASLHRDLAFLLSLGAIPLACGVDEEGASMSASDSTGATTTGVMTSTATMSESTTSGGATGTSHSSTASSSTSADACGTPVDGDVVCEAHQVKIDECFPGGDSQAAIERCKSELQGLAVFHSGTACVEAHITYLQCIAETSCTVLKNVDAPCLELWDARKSACASEPGEVCVAYGAKALECDPDADAAYSTDLCQGYFVDLGSYYGCLCGAENEDFFACLTALSCEDFFYQVGCEHLYPPCEDLVP